VSEIVECIGRSGDILTVVRGQEGTAPQTFNLSDNVELRITASSLNLFAIGGGSGGTASGTSVANFTATAGQTVFTLPWSYTQGIENLAIFVNGSKQIVNVNYVETSTTSFTMSNGLNVGDLVQAIYNLPLSGGVINADNVTYNEGSAGAVNQTVQDKLQESVSVMDFGATGDGVTDDTAAINAAISAAKSVVFPPGTYKVTSTIEVGTQRVLMGEFPNALTGTGNTLSVIIGTTASIGDGNPILQAAATGSTQSIVIKNLTIRGDTVVDLTDLSTMSSTGIIGMNVRGVKQGMEFIDCTFRNLKSAVVDTIGTGNYLDKITFSKCFIFGCYLGIDVTPTAGLSLDNCYFDENYNWVDSNYVHINSTRFNNSSFAQEYCQVKATSIIADNTYVEGGNNWFAPTSYLSVRGSYFSEAFSASGSTKFSVNPQANGCYINIEGTRIGTNTRVVNFDTTTANTHRFRLIGNTNGLNFGPTSSIYAYIVTGMAVEGYSNTQTAWNVNEGNSAVLPGALTTVADATERRFPLLCRSVSWDTSVNFSLSFPEELRDFSSSATTIDCANFTVLGSNNGGGGTVAYMAKVCIYNGYGAVWNAYIYGPDAASYTVTLTNKTSTSVDVVLAETHSGTSEVLVLESATENCKITFT
jgi:hypothetical protein